MLSAHRSQELFGVLFDSVCMIIPNLDVALKVLDEGFILCRRVFNTLKQKTKHSDDNSGQVVSDRTKNKERNYDGV